MLLQPPDRELHDVLLEQARQVEWIASSGKKVLPDEQAVAIEPLTQEANMSEPFNPGPDEESSPDLEVQTEPSDPVVSAEPEPLPEPRDEQKEVSS